jgi:DNA-binding protein HU-beta
VIARLRRLNSEAKTTKTAMTRITSPTVQQEESQMATPKRMTKAQVISDIATYSELDKKSVGKVFEGLTDLIKKQLGPRGPGEFVIPGLLKLKTVKKKAIPAGERRNPFTGQMQHFPAKPASKKVRATALKALKDLIQ